MPRTRNRRGFTLIELLIVVVIIGILASIAIGGFRKSKEKAFLSVIKSDLRNIATAQEAYYDANNTYANSAPILGYSLSNGIIVNSFMGNAQGWAVALTHIGANPRVCALYHGNVAPVAPAVTEGIITCA